MEEQIPVPKPEGNNNSWMVSDAEAVRLDPFRHDENQRDRFGQSPLVSKIGAKRDAKAPVVKAGSKAPSIFGGAYKSIGVKKLGYLLGTKGGYKDFKGLYGSTVNGIVVSSDIIKKLNDLRKQSMSGSTIEVKERDLQLFANKLARGQMHLKDNNPKDYNTNQVFLGILKDKTGIIPKIY
jgi:hypothetical protein